MSLDDIHSTYDCEPCDYTENEIIMGVRHKTLAIEGVQFHPESIVTAPGKQLLQNFLNMKETAAAGAV